MNEHRWQGYTHAELYEQIHQGPGPDASLTSMRRWTQLAKALDEIDAGLNAAVSAAMAGWRGHASESAGRNLRPLGDWAQQSEQAAGYMHDCAEHQADLVGRVRAEMPPPVPVRAEAPGPWQSALVHLFGGQTDYEVQEAKQHAAEQRAFEVMRGYQAASEANTASLASFTPPPQVVVDAATATSARPGSVGTGTITITWGSTPVGPASGGSYGRRTSAAGHLTRGAHGRASARAVGSRASMGTRAGSYRRSDNDSDTDVDREVTEYCGNGEGFFDAQQASARPVIGDGPG